MTDKCFYCRQDIQTIRGFSDPVFIHHKTPGGDVCDGWGTSVKNSATLFELEQLRRENDELRARVKQLEANHVYQVTKGDDSNGRNQNSISHELAGEKLQRSSAAMAGTQAVGPDAGQGGEGGESS